MDLEIGLAISNNGPPRIPFLKELDLISYVNRKGKQVYNEENDDNCSTLSYDGDYYDDNEEVINEVVEMETLSLLHWDNKYLYEDDNQLPRRLCNSTSFIIENEGDTLVGWPPINTRRKKLNDAPQNQHYHQNNGGRSMFIKVQMEGFFITRKINLKLYQSYAALISTLLTMFGKGHDNIDDYKLTYQDRDGHWLLAGDVPWRTFIESVQRLKLRRDD